MSPNCTISEAKSNLERKLNIVFEAILSVEDKNLINDV
jgi:hypothetical protein